MRFANHRAVVATARVVVLRRSAWLSCVCKQLPVGVHFRPYASGSDGCVLLLLWGIEEPFHFGVSWAWATPAHAEPRAAPASASWRRPYGTLGTHCTRLCIAAAVASSSARRASVQHVVPRGRRPNDG